MKQVLVTTEFRGVFFGYMEDESKLPLEVTLKDARNCIQWAEDVGGFMGLAEKGPTKNCMIGPKVIQITLYKISSVTLVSKEAENAWVNWPPKNEDK